MLDRPHAPLQLTRLHRSLRGHMLSYEGSFPLRLPYIAVLTRSRLHNGEALCHSPCRPSRFLEVALAQRSLCKEARCGSAQRSPCKPRVLGISGIRFQGNLPFKRHIHQRAYGKVSDRRHICAETRCSGQAHAAPAPSSETA